VATRALPITLRDLKIADVHSARLALLPRLPDTADEILGIAAVTGADPSRDVFLRERANEQTVKTLDLAGYRTIAFATHGLVAGDLDGLTQPALALSAPEVAKVEGDGLLTMEEILGLRLNADWVVLSACNTASGQGAGSEAISGLGRAFFYAGARALLVSNWPVETTSARALTTDLFQRQSADPGLTRAKALQQTMNGLIDDGHYVDPKTNRVVFSYAHPIFWAPFTLVGDGGGGR
jgi:CHAT domain-containing protein